jgi:hypothetical protein
VSEKKCTGEKGELVTFILHSFFRGEKAREGERERRGEEYAATAGPSARFLLPRDFLFLSTTS